MGSDLARWFVSLCIASCACAQDGWSGSLHAVLHGKLVKKYFQAPRVVQNPPFGWFIELDSSSQNKISDLYNNLSQHEKEIYDDLDLKCIRVLAGHFAIREWARDHDSEEISVIGEISEPDLLGYELQAFYFTPEDVTPEITEEEKALACRYLDEHPWEPNSFDWDEDKDDSLVLSDDKQERLVSMSGKLHLEIVSNDPEYGEIENGGYPIYCWMIKLDRKSFEIACNTPVRACFQTPSSIRHSKNGDEMCLTGNYDPEWLCDHIHQTVTVQGYLWHAHTGHHHTPVMLDTAPWFK